MGPKASTKAFDYLRVAPQIHITIGNARQHVLGLDAQLCVKDARDALTITLA
jgi:hypothetical protein